MDSKNSDENVEFKQFVHKKLQYYNDLLSKTTITIYKHKLLCVITSSEATNGLNQIEGIYKVTKHIHHSIDHKEYSIELQDEILTMLQTCNDMIYALFKDFGTQHITDVLTVCFGASYIANEVKQMDPLMTSKYNLIKKYCSPIQFSIIQLDKKQSKPTYNDPSPNSNGSTNSNIIAIHTNDNTILNNNTSLNNNTNLTHTNTLDCFSMSSTNKQFHTKVYGFKVCFKNIAQQKTIIIYCLAENILMPYLQNEYILNRLNTLNTHIPNSSYFKNETIFQNFVNGLTLNELCTYTNEEIYNRFVGFVNQSTLMKQKPISQLVKEFLNSDIYNQRTTLIQLLIHSDNPEYNYISYLLYDLLSNDEKGKIDTQDQTSIYDSLPWNIKSLFKHSMKTTITYTKTLTNIDNNKIPLEQQICLLKVSDSVKEKAMVKLKEVKAKSEDSGSKARQYLEGLLRIPFGIYKEEPILKIISDCNQEFKQLLGIQDLSSDLSIAIKETYSTFELQTHIQNIKHTVMPLKLQQLHQTVQSYLKSCKRNTLIDVTIATNAFTKKNNLTFKKLYHSAKKNDYLFTSLYTYYQSLYSQCETNQKFDLMCEFLQMIHNQSLISTFDIYKQMSIVDHKWNTVKHEMDNVRNILDGAVYGHDQAKRQIERVIGQWMSGDQKGYCFGFEGPPGLGKTSIAKKGIAKCLMDEHGNARPFGFIAIGGSSNSSTLDGHNYTYVGSTWGRIVDILMDSKCMNPIIFIDELDKISNTENGKEIIGSLTHLVDPTQNDEFHDKYFSGIDIDLSKVLFIFSYNDVNLIDRILLDRIHRIQFKNLCVDEKLVITRNHLLPEIYEKIALQDVIHMSDEVIKYIIETYTLEPGVRKLKEILFEIISEINLEILHNKTDGFIQKEGVENANLTIEITNELVKDKYLKDRREIKEKKIHANSEIGIINGLWANSLGKGGITPIQCTYFPTTTFLELKLTGMQGDVMKESMNVAKTLAYTLTPLGTKKALLKQYKQTNLQGLHIHCPEGAVPKDGPSAGTAITVTIYSLLNNKRIKHNVAITGEINLQGNVTEIGGLHLKILGGIKAGVKDFIYPLENQDDYKSFMEKYGSKTIVEGIRFHPVSHIHEVLELVFE